MKAPLSKSVLVRLASAAMRSDQFRLIRYAFAGVVVSLGYTFTIVALVEWWGLMRAEAANTVSLILWTTPSRSH